MTPYFLLVLGLLIPLLAYPQSSSEGLSLALFGDSLSTSFHLDSKWKVLVQSRSSGLKDQNWYLDTDPSAQSIFSLTEQVSQLLGQPVVSTNLSTVGAFVPNLDIQPGMKESILGSSSLVEQVGSVLKMRKLPSLILSWVGHNNLDYRNWQGVTAANRRALFEAHAQKFAKEYVQDLESLFVRAAREKERLAILVLGLVNFESFFEARSRIEKERVPGTYPFLEESMKVFQSMAVESRAGMVELATLLNQELRMAIQNRAKTLPENILLIYSDALAEVDLHLKETLSYEDAWHPSALGHGIFANAVFRSNEFQSGVLPFLQRK